MHVAPFTIDVPQAAIDDLHERLDRTRFPDTIDGPGWTYGFHRDYLRAIVYTWRHDFDWRAHERRWNGLPQFRADVDGFGIHFLHYRSPKANAPAIVLTHGWPGSFLELVRVAELLAADFDVVVPSLPGFGFSDRPTQPGMNTFAIAALWHSLMRGLGYATFFAHGGDFGASVTTILAWQHPQSVRAIHLNYIPGGYRPYVGDEAPLADDEKQFQIDNDRWWNESGAYAHVQRNEPQTLAFALNDSPAGLAAWLLDKFRLWADCGGDLESRFLRDDLLAMVSLYWFTETIHSSCRLYLESSKRLLTFARGERIAVPCGIARFPKEEPFPPRRWIERVYDVAQWTDMPRGGHFAALEEPELLAADIARFFSGR